MLAQAGQKRLSGGPIRTSGPAGTGNVAGNRPIASIGAEHRNEKTSTERARTSQSLARHHQTLQRVRSGETPALDSDRIHTGAAGSGETLVAPSQRTLY